MSHIPGLCANSLALNLALDLMLFRNGCSGKSGLQFAHGIQCIGCGRVSASQWGGSALHCRPHSNSSDSQLDPHMTSTRKRLLRRDAVIGSTVALTYFANCDDQAFLFPDMLHFDWTEIGSSQNHFPFLPYDSIFMADGHHHKPCRPLLEGRPYSKKF